MSILTLLLLLIVAAIVIWAVPKALAGDWRGLVMAVVILFVVLWILGAFGVTLPTVPTIR